MHKHNNNLNNKNFHVYTINCPRNKRNTKQPNLQVNKRLRTCILIMLIFGLAITLECRLL